MGMIVRQVKYQYELRLWTCLTLRHYLFFVFWVAFFTLLLDSFADRSYFRSFFAASLRIFLVQFSTLLYHSTDSRVLCRSSWLKWGSCLGPCLSWFHRLQAHQNVVDSLLFLKDNGHFLQHARMILYVRYESANLRSDMQSGALWTLKNQYQLQTLYLLQTWGAPQSPPLLRQSVQAMHLSCVSQGWAFCSKLRHHYFWGTCWFYEEYIFHIGCSGNFPQGLLSLLEQAQSLLSLFPISDTFFKEILWSFACFRIEEGIIASPAFPVSKRKRLTYHDRPSKVLKSCTFP